jgi:hypothetical protein
VCGLRCFSIHKSMISGSREDRITRSYVMFHGIT